MKKIEELTQQELEMVVAEYMSPDTKTGDIVKKYDLAIRPNLLRKYLPEVKTNVLCPWCGEPMYAGFRSKGVLDNPYCKKCGHIDYSNDDRLNKSTCTCKYCTELRLGMDEIKQMMIQQIYDVEYPLIPFTSLSLEDQFHVITILNDSEFNPDNNEMRIIRNFNKHSLYFHDLRVRHVFSISPDNSIDAFSEKDFPYISLVYHTIFRVHIFFENNEFSDGINKSVVLAACPEEKYNLFMAVMHADVMDRFRKLMNERRLDFEIMAGAEDEFKKLYDVLSYAQIITLCWSVARYYLDKTTTGQIYRKNVGKSALSTAVTFHRKNSDKGWGVSNSEVSFAGEELKDLLSTFGMDIRILQKIVTMNDFE